MEVSVGWKPGEKSRNGGGREEEYILRRQY